MMRKAKKSHKSVDRKKLLKQGLIEKASSNYDPQSSGSYPEAKGYWMNDYWRARSSAIYAIGYYSNTEQLYVWYNQAMFYIYLNVDAATYKSLCAAASVGTYVAQAIKTNYVHSGPYVGLPRYVLKGM